MPEQPVVKPQKHSTGVTLADIWLFTRDDATMRPLLQTAAREGQATISPDG